MTLLDHSELVVHPFSTPSLNKFRPDPKGPLSGTNIFFQQNRANSFCLGLFQFWSKLHDEKMIKFLIVEKS